MRMMPLKQKVFSVRKASRLFGSPTKAIGSFAPPTKVNRLFNVPIKIYYIRIKRNLISLDLSP
jgi:hypothetical protein